MATLPIFAQVAPQQPGYPQDSATAAPQSAADGGDQDASEPGPGVARISLLNGDVSVRRGDSGDYVAATPNAPVMVQDSIQTGSGARAEVQFDATSMIRLAQNTEVHFTDLQPGHSQMQLGRGTVTFRILRDTNGQVEIDTPSVAIRPAHTGIYRVTVTDDGQTYITPRAGQLEVFTPKGSQMVQVGQTMMARGPSSDPEYQFVAALKVDEWDGWSDSRDRGLQQAWATTSQYVPPDVYGTEDLAGHGQWVNTPDYGGPAWYPQVGPDWSPYSVGRWAWEDYYGWTWISYDPWGWAPYHYGRWFFRAGFGWGWWPGSFQSRYFWSPALVGFFGFGHGGVGFGRIGWVPLAPFEHYNAWYGRGGLRGTTIVNNVNIANTYRNARVGNGVMAMNSQQFGRGSTGYARVSGAELRGASVLHGSVPVRPSGQSMHFTDRPTSTVAKTNFSQTRFATHSPASTVQRNSSTSQGGQRFGGAGTSPSGTASGGTFNRYGGSTGQSGSQVAGARSFGSTPGTRNIPQSSSTTSGSWNRFGSSSGSSTTGGSPAYRGTSNYGSTGGREPLRVSPPLVRERGAYSAPASSAPRSSSPGYSAPRYSPPTYSAPRYSAPSYPAPAQRSAPAPARSAPSGGSSHSSGSSGGGSHHR